jgi:hypothetical protein
MNERASNNSSHDYSKELMPLFFFLFSAVGLLCSLGGAIEMYRTQTHILSLNKVGPALFWAGTVFIALALITLICMGRVSRNEVIRDFLSGVCVCDMVFTIYENVTTLNQR